MSHFACIVMPHHGHIDPMAVLARELERRGHEVTFFHVADVGPRVRRHGLDFVALGAATHPPGWLEAATRRLGQVNGYVRLRAVLKDIAGVTAMLCDELPAALRAHRIDFVIADQIEAAGGLTAYHLGLPFVSLAAMLPMNWEEGVPSPFVGWSYGESRWHRYRNIASAFGAKKAVGPIGDVIESVATRWRIMRGRQIERYMSGFAQISQLTPSIDFPRRSLIGCFHYCGPLREGAIQPKAAGRTGRAYASLGTLQGHRLALFERILRATQSCGLELTITHGGRLSDDEARRLSRKAEVRDFVVQGEVLRSVDVAILHGGMNTVLDALAAGVPLVVLPLAFEQGATAARVARSGAGRRCRPYLAPPGRLAATIGEVAGNPAYAERAATIRDEIARAGGVVRAADIVEHVARTGRPCLNDEARAREPAAA